MFKMSPKRIVGLCYAAMDIASRLKEFVYSHSHMFAQLCAFEKLFKPRSSGNPNETVKATIRAPAAFLKHLLALAFGSKNVLIGSSGLAPPIESSLA